MKLLLIMILLLNSAMLLNTGRTTQTSSRTENAVSRIEKKLTERCEPNLENEKRCTRIQYLYKNGHFRGVKCLRWED